MKKIVFVAPFLLSTILLVSVASAADISVNVKELLGARVTSLQYGEKNLVNFSVEIYNTGGFPYLARPRIDVTRPDGSTFTSWGQEKVIKSGERSIFNLFWFTDEAGFFPARLRYYFGGEQQSIDFVINKSSSNQYKNAFSIRDFRTYDKYVVFDVISSVDAKGVVILPQKYPPGWIFETRQIDRLTPSISRTVVLPYSGIYVPSDIEILIASDSGNYATIVPLKMEKERGFDRILHTVQDGLKIVFSGAK
jgi:hypothetical protein